jgi:Rrf2 family transcriptional regulator, nitric oxide-sensitive transcriptional repressor
MWYRQYQFWRILMRLLASTDFALRVLMRLSAAPDTHVSTDTLARELVVSRHHLHKIVQYLTEAGLVRTIRGAHGGVMLARPASEIKVGEVIRSHEHDQPLVECFRADGGACTLLPRCRLRGMLDAAKNAFYQQLDRYTLADCLARQSLSAPGHPNRKRQRSSEHSVRQRHKGSR